MIRSVFRTYTLREIMFTESTTNFCTTSGRYLLFAVSINHSDYFSLESNCSASELGRNIFMKIISNTCEFLFCSLFDTHIFFWSRFQWRSIHFEYKWFLWEVSCYNYFMTDIFNDLRYFVSIWHFKFPFEINFFTWIIISILLRSYLTRTTHYRVLPNFHI